MAKVDPAGLEDLVREAGVSARTAKKLRDANEPKAAATKKPRGHGAPTQEQIVIEDI